MDRYRKWSEEEEKLLVELRNNGIPYKEIGLKLGRTRCAICKKLDKLVLIRNKKPREKKVRVCQSLSQQKKTVFDRRMNALTAIERALNACTLSKRP